jgi:hypothetical protein
VAVSLTETPTGGFGGGLVRGVDRARRRLEDLAGVGAAQPISGAELERLAVAEQRTFRWRSSSAARWCLG